VGLQENKKGAQYWAPYLITRWVQHYLFPPWLPELEPPLWPFSPEDLPPLDFSSSPLEEFPWPFFVVGMIVIFYITSQYCDRK